LPSEKLELLTQVLKLSCEKLELLTRVPKLPGEKLELLTQVPRLSGEKFEWRNQLIPSFFWEKEKGEQKKTAKVGITKKT